MKTDILCSITFQEMSFVHWYTLDELGPTINANVCPYFFISKLIIKKDNKTMFIPVSNGITEMSSEKPLPVLTFETIFRNDGLDVMLKSDITGSVTVHYTGSGLNKNVRPQFIQNTKHTGKMSTFIIEPLDRKTSELTSRELANINAIEEWLNDFEVVGFEWQAKSSHGVTHKINDTHYEKYKITRGENDHGELIKITSTNDFPPIFLNLWGVPNRIINRLVGELEARAKIYSYEDENRFFDYLETTIGVGAYTVIREPAYGDVIYNKNPKTFPLFRDKYYRGVITSGHQLYDCYKIYNEMITPKLIDGAKQFYSSMEVNNKTSIRLKDTDIIYIITEEVTEDQYDKIATLLVMANIDRNIKLIGEIVRKHKLESIVGAQQS